MNQKQKLKYLLNASNRHEAVLNDMRNEIDTLRKTLEALSYKHLQEDFEKSKAVVQNNNLELEGDIDVAHKISEFAVSILQEYAKENQTLIRSTSDLSPLEEWLLERMYLQQNGE